MLNLKSPHLGEWTPAAIAAAFLLVIAFTFGGASRLNELRVAVIELSALPLLVLGVAALSRHIRPEHPRYALWIVAGAICLPLLQLIPLPPSVWTALPGRDQARLALEIANIPVGWAPQSFTPDRTWRAFLALLPPVAMFIAVLSLRTTIHRRLVYAVLGMALVAVLLGTAQLASGGERLYPWPTTDAGAVAGTFANRNHLATLCLISLPFAAVLGAGAMRRDGRDFRLWLAVLFIGLIVVAIGVIRSRAGIVLVGPVLVTSAIAAWVASGRGRPNPRLLALAGAAAAGAASVAIFALAPLLDRFDRSSSTEGRFENWPIVAEAANAFLPLGSGLGSFDTVYRSVEPLTQLDETYFNQAHNEYLEAWLETGWLGPLLVVAFLIWFTRRAWAAWLSRSSTPRDLQRAASIAIGTILLHSIVDYPLRTETIAVIFALCCAILELSSRNDAELVGERHRQQRRSA